MLRNAEVIDEDEINVDHVALGNKVRLYDEEFEEEVEYSIVGSTEANPVEGKISNESPVFLPTSMKFFESLSIRKAQTGHSSVPAIINRFQISEGESPLFIRTASL